jgi:hypothetical protein
MTSPVRSPEGPSHRAPILVVVLALVAAGIVAGRAHSAPAARTAAPTDAAQTPPSGTLSAAWYCPGMPSPFPNRDQTLTLSNIGAAKTDAVVTIDPDDGSDPVVRTLSVAGHTVRTFDRATLDPVGGTAKQQDRPPAASERLPSGPLVVEPMSPDVVVQAGLESGTRLDQVNCATSAAADWYFAAGTTLRGVSQWLVLDNPFSTDARVDVSVRTEVGVRLLPDLQGLDVSGRSRVVVQMHNEAVRQERVAVEVHADLGKVVAAQTLQFDPASGGPTGVASTLGVLAPATRWWFTDGRTAPGASQWVALTNLGPLDAKVDVQALIGSDAIVQPVRASVPPDGVVWVRIGNCQGSDGECLRVPASRGYQLVVSDVGVPIVAQTLSRNGSDSGSPGVTTSIGSTAPADRWVVARTHARDDRSTSISVTVPGLHDAHLSVDVVHSGRVEHPSALQGVTVQPSARYVVPQSALPERDAVLVLTADEPIIVESTIYAAQEATRGPGIPSR